MTKYNFTSAPNRLNNHSVKWQATETDPEVLPMWIADMDFETFPEMSQAVKKFADYGVYGYGYPPKTLYDAIISWEKQEHHYEIKQEDIILISGVVPAITVGIQAFTQPGDAVLINTPLYPPFARTIKLNNRQLVTNSLVEVNGRFEIDFEQLEKDIVENDVKLYAFCSPHNPGGRVWEKTELIKIAELCKQYDVRLISDEIHQDLTLFDNQHHSFNTVGDYASFAIVLSSATKTFNIAGTGTAFVLIEDERLKKKFKTQQLANNQHEVTTLGLLATETALTYGKPWLVELKKVLVDNLSYLVTYFEEHAPRVKVMQPEGTYLIWVDFSDYGLSDDILYGLFRDEAKVILNNGTSFGVEGKGHVRVNIAAPLEHVKQAVQRIVAVLPKD